MRLASSRVVVDPHTAVDTGGVHTVVARGPASATREGPAPRFVSSELLVLVVGPIALAAVALAGPARAILDGRARRFVARGVERLLVAVLGATAVGPLVDDVATLGRARRFVARSVERLLVAFLGATAVGPLVYDGATLESIVVVVVLVSVRRDVLNLRTNVVFDVKVIYHL